MTAEREREMKRKFAIGVDFGTQSGRAVLVELGTARELAVSVCAYAHGVMDRELPDGTPLPPDWALQHPQDYLDVLYTAVPDVLRQTGIDPADIVGLGIDFTACTMLPIDRDGTPLCMLEPYKNCPHSYVKLWKHHAAQDEADRINETASRRGESFLLRYGGKISSEWMFPKILQILNEAPDIYAAADRFIEAGDWTVLALTGAEARSGCMAGYKAIWSRRDGYPSPDFFRALDPRLERVIDEKLSRNILPLGSKAGELTAGMAARTGLRPGTPVAFANVDAHVTGPATGSSRPGEMLMIMGTSTCHMVVGEEARLVPGMCGVVEDGILPGFYGYEAGQSCVGDHFEWFVENCVPGAYEREAREKGIDIHALLTEKAARLRPARAAWWRWTGGTAIVRCGWTPI
jgi:L-ribulokinase